jgi:hypothetical protein
LVFGDSSSINGSRKAAFTTEAQRGEAATKKENITLTTKVTKSTKEKFEIRISKFEFRNVYTLCASW